MSLAVNNSRLECVVALPRPQTAAQERALVVQFLAGLGKLFEGGGGRERADRLLRAMRHSSSCPRCAAACHLFEGSGQDERYRPGLRADLLQRLYFKYLKHGGAVSIWWHGDVELDWALVSGLAQMAYSCNQCGRCAQLCRSADHALIARELRGVFRDMGIAPPRLRRPSVDATAVREHIGLIDQATSQRAGIEFRTPWDIEGAEVLLVQPASSVFDWPENVGALGLVLSAAGVKWTMSSELCALDAGEGSGLDEAGQGRAAHQHHQVAQQLNAKRLVVGECGRTYAVLDDAERAASSQFTVAPESVLALMHEVVRGGRVEFDPIRNDFPVTLHDPCNLARRGVIEPQREVLRRLCPQFREMDPWAEKNYCCGGGGGLVQMAGQEAREFRLEVSGRKKMDQVLDAFSECLDAETRKYLCSPCGDCKTQLRDLLAEHAPWERNRILCGGLAELVANAMAAVRPGFLQWERR